jgi:hypothetical protein
MHSAVCVEGHGIIIYGGRANGSSAVLNDVIALDTGGLSILFYPSPHFLS